MRVRVTPDGPSATTRHCGWEVAVVNWQVNDTVRSYSVVTLCGWTVKAAIKEEDKITRLKCLAAVHEPAK